MRLRFAVPTIACLLVGWAATAQADAPPAAPIFYCPTPGKGAPAPAPIAAKPSLHAAHKARATVHRHPGCPTERIAAQRHRWRGPAAAAPKALASNDVSASQAFIYRYERALHGLDARAADEAWAEGRHPPCPPRDCPVPDAWRRGGRPDAGEFAERAPPPPPVEQRRLRPPVVAVAPAPPPPSIHAYAWQDPHSGYRYEEREQQSEQAGGWRYSESDGRGQYQHWGDHFAGERGWDGRDDRHQDDSERRWAAPRYRCPPPVPASSCAARADAPVRHSDVAVAGRDTAGYLTWPGKTE